MERKRDCELSQTEKEINKLIKAHYREVFKATSFSPRRPPVPFPTEAQQNEPVLEKGFWKGKGWWV